MIKDELQHHGIKGQKWGIRRFQPYSKNGKERDERNNSYRKKSMRFKKKKNFRSGDKRNGSIGSIEKKEQKRIEAANKRRKELDRILREGKASEIIKNKKYYSTKQLQEAANRIMWENKLSDFADKEKTRAFKKINGYMSTAKTVNDWVSTGINSKKNLDYLITTFEYGAKKSMKKKR